MKEEIEEPTDRPLARWTEMIEPASLSTRPGAQRFVVTIKLAEKSAKTATSLVREANAALKKKILSTPGCDLTAELVLVDSDRTRLQRALASFDTFKAAQAFFLFLEELGLRVHKVSAELEEFGTKKYDPWLEKITNAWWPWLAKLGNPPPEMPMMKVTNRLDLSEGSKYKMGKRGKLAATDEEGRDDTPDRDRDEDAGGSKRARKKPRKNQDD